ncbi:Outer membrane protein TolC [Celeribacter neptunius]|uniref:Outer membrane protein TolC n=2 Tax=Celeribacter neptunius TaxID=588602 RepID=A0A1I3QCH9_9RHOB|nr:Outer membrane protein TolC [Celeribacter neptunius]
MASRRAAEFERFPKLVPAVNVPVANSSSAEASNDPSIGITLEQTLYDFGQTRMRLERADSDIEAKRIEVWSERNDAVLNGLLAAVDAARLTQQLTMFHDLEKLLLKLEQRLEARTSGGVAGKGETLLITSALQKAQADTIRAQTDLRAAQSQLARLLPANQPAPALSLSAARKMCRRDLPQTTAPRVAMATVSLVQAETDSRLIRGKRFPRIVAQAGASMTTAGSPATSIGIQLDTTNMLGLGQGKVIESYDANVEARKRALAQANEDIATELDQHRMEFRGFLDSEQQLQTLVASKAETLALFDDQIAAGRLSLTDGIDLYREDADMRIQLLDIRANIVANCLQTAAILGTLAEYEVGDE